MTNLPALHRRATDAFSVRVDGLLPEQFGDPTPCTEWDIGALLGHNVHENLWVPPIMDGMTVEQVGDRFERGVLGDDPPGAWHAAAEPACAAIEREGAMERTVHLSFGDVAGAEYTRQRIVDLVVHTWDLAKAAGLDESLDEDTVSACLAWGEAWKPMLAQASDWFEPPIEPATHAGAQTRLLNVFGRDPAR